MSFEEPSESQLQDRVAALSKKNGDRDHHLTELFQIIVGYDEDNKFYFAQVSSMRDNKSFTPASNNLGILLKSIRLELLKKDVQLRKPVIIRP